MTDQDVTPETAQPEGPTRSGFIALIGAPAANTVKYTMTKAISDDPTAGAASGDTASAVRSRP